MYRILFYLLFLAVLLAPAGSASAALPDAWASQDIGGVGQPGSADESAGVWTVHGSGADIWGTSDEFHFCYTQLSGDTEIIARVHPIGGGSHEWTKAGVMIRDTLDPTSMHSFMARTNNTGTAHAFSAQYRQTTGGDSSNPADIVPGDYVATEPYWVKVNRVGNDFTESISPDGETWNDRTTVTIAMTDPVYVGFAVTSHDDAQTMIGIFDSALLNGEEIGTCGAHSPDPADGSFPAPEYWEGNVYMILDFIPGQCTEGYYSEGFFSTDKALVDAMDPSVSLGTDPPWPAVDDNAWVVGYDDPGIPEHARTPLVPGTTYYWSTASFDGTEWFPSATWSFTPIPRQAWGPNPPDGALYVPTEGTMTWNLGDVDPTGFTLSYDVYIGTSATAVEDANVVDNPSVAEFMANVGTESYDYSGIADGVENFWRVDTKLTLTRPPFTSKYAKGDVWSFTSLPEPPVFPVEDPNLKAHYKLDGAYDYWIVDYSGHDNHGMPQGDLLAAPYVPGQIDNGLDFDGVGDYVTTGKTAADLGIEGANPKTVTAWVYTRSFNDGGIYDIGSNQNGRNWSLRTLGTVNTWRAQRWGYPDFDFDFTYPSQNEWVHFALLYEGSATNMSRCYANAVVVGSQNAAMDTNPADRLFEIGRWNVTNFFDGIIDDLRVYDKALTDKQIKVLAGFMKATNPDPANGSADAPKSVTLGWEPGVYAAAVNGSVVYYSADQDAVINRTASSATVSTGSYPLPTTLTLGDVMYWAVDTVNGVETWPGDIWTFTVRNYRMVDDMETYTPWTIPGNNIFEAWRDGEGNCQPGNGNQTGSTLTENVDMAYVLGGLQSMKYEFDNDGQVYSPCTMTITPRPYLYSRIEAQTATLPSGIGSNWTVEGVKALQINWMGQLGNATTEPLWVQLQDSSKTYGTKVFYGDQEGEDIADMNDPTWHQWDIDLADFNVNLNNVVSIVIGIGNEGATTAGGSGTIYIDDIRLYTPRCVPMRAKPDGDFDNSCKVDYPDVATMFDNWLLQDVPEVPDSGWLTSDIGDVNVLTGSYSDLGGGEFTMTGAGADIWDNADGFFYRYKPLAGDGRLTVRVTDISGPSTNDWRKAGVMIRETLDAGSKHAFMATSPVGGGGKSFQRRIETDLASTSAHDIPPTVTTPICLRIARQGDTFRGFYNIGGGWVQQGGPVTIEMAENVYIGFAVTSHDYTNSSTVTFDNVCSGDFIEPDLVTNGVIDFEDYAELLDAWAEEVLWPE